MTNNTKSKFAVGATVYVPSLKKEAKVYTYSRDMKTVKVSVIVKFDKETGERTTKLETVNVSELKPVRKNKKTKKSPKYNPNEYFYHVKDFQSAFGQPVADKPTPMDSERALNRSVWSVEEIVEFIHASSHSKDQFISLFNKLIEGAEKAFEKSLESPVPTNDFDRLVAQVDALTDEAYFNNGSFVEIGIKPYNPFKIVQNANMGKLHIDENGKKYPKYRESDGKIQKPENWEENFAPEPLLRKEVQRQIDLADKGNKQ